MVVGDDLVVSVCIARLMGVRHGRQRKGADRERRENGRELSGGGHFLRCYASRLQAATEESLDRASVGKPLEPSVSMPAYASVTVRNWNTTTRLLDMMEKR